MRSKLQKHIIKVIANNTVNWYECTGAIEKDLIPFHKHSWQEQYINYSELFRKCLTFWNDDSENWQQIYKARKVSLSRALRSLVKKGLVEALALAWVLITNQHQDLLRWQGRGRRARDKDFPVCKDDVPQYKMLGLSEKGWQIARELLGSEVIGMCERLKRELESGKTKENNS